MVAIQRWVWMESLNASSHGSFTTVSGQRYLSPKECLMKSLVGGDSWLAGDQAASETLHAGESAPERAEGQLLDDRRLIGILLKRSDHRGVFEGDHPNVKHWRSGNGYYGPLRPGLRP